MYGKRSEESKVGERFTGSKSLFSGHLLSPDYYYYQLFLSPLKSVFIRLCVYLLLPFKSLSEGHRYILDPYIILQRVLSLFYHPSQSKLRMLFEHSIHCNKRKISIPFLTKSLNGFQCPLYSPSRSSSTKKVETR